MPIACRVCAHPHRADIDQRLGWQAVNVSALAREYGLKRDAVMNHRSRHLPDFLPSFDATNAAPGDLSRNAEAKRLYDLALDLIAQVQAGVLVQVGKPDAETGEVQYERLFSPTAMARSLGEARKILGMISALAAVPAKSQPSESTSPSLDAAMLKALARFEERVASEQQPTDALIIEEAAPSHESTSRAIEQARAESVPAASFDRVEGGAGKTGGRDVASSGVPNPDTPEKMSDPTENTPDIDQMEPIRSDNARSEPDQAKRSAELFIAGLPAEIRAHIAEVLDQHSSNDVLNPERIERPWPGNWAATAEERRAAGWPDLAPLATDGGTATDPSTHHGPSWGVSAEEELALPPRARRRAPRPNPETVDPSRLTQR